MRHLRARLARARRAHTTIVDGGWAWYRAGYIAALDDVERTGMRPLTDDTKRRAADRSLQKWVDAPLDALAETQEREP